MAKKKKKAQASPAPADPNLQSIAHQSRTTLFTRKVVSKKAYKRKPKHKNSRDWASFLPSAFYLSLAA
ncbi:hypothetical protein [uncultured Microscilla sp.]|uniref:hypothetical protein n=1 Tax=uncultured Microscilla sp. TaxID=432653 RepID=UPI002621200B|nr:hypothetical protein [uncultured Microscilla sp.]